MKTIFKTSLWILAGVTVYLVAGIIIHTLVPPERPDLNSYIQPGDRLVSRFEGFEQTVISVHDGWIHGRLEVRPHAVGPPEHFHEHFTEVFTVKSGKLSIMVAGEKRTLHAGESITIPPMTNHKPFNETNETVVVESEDQRSVPVQFGFILTQLYGFMDTFENGPSLPQMMMQLSVYGNEADSWIADGPPLVVQKAMRLLMAPTARLLGYKYYNEQYKPIRAAA